MFRLSYVSRLRQQLTIPQLMAGYADSWQPNPKQGQQFWLVAHTVCVLFANTICSTQSICYLMQSVSKSLSWFYTHTLLGTHHSSKGNIEILPYIWFTRHTDARNTYEANNTRNGPRVWLIYSWMDIHVSLCVCVENYLSFVLESSASLLAFCRRLFNFSERWSSDS